MTKKDNLKKLYSIRHLLELPLKETEFKKESGNHLIRTYLYSDYFIKIKIEGYKGNDLKTVADLVFATLRPNLASQTTTFEFKAMCDRNILMFLANLCKKSRCEVKLSTGSEYINDDAKPLNAVFGGTGAKSVYAGNICGEINKTYLEDEFDTFSKDLKRHLEYIIENIRFSQGDLEYLKIQNGLAYIKQVRDEEIEKLAENI